MLLQYIDVSAQANQSVIVTVVPNIIPLSTANVNYEVSVSIATEWLHYYVTIHSIGRCIQRGEII